MNTSGGEPGPSSNSSTENPVQRTTTMMPVISNSTSVPSSADTVMSDVLDYAAPPIENEPKPDWHVRYLSDLVPKQTRENSTVAAITATASVETKEKGIIRLLQGIGGERSPIRLGVSDLFL